MESFYVQLEDRAPYMYITTLVNRVVFSLGLSKWSCEHYTNWA